VLLAAALATMAAPAAELPPQAVAAALALATEAAQALAPPDARVLASAGALDPRLKLAPCAAVQPYLAAGSPSWGRTRVGMRCTQGSTRWNVYLPVTVQVLAPALVSSANLPAGARLDDSQMVLAEVDWAAAAAPPFTADQALAGRVLARPVAAGAAFRPADLQPRLWFVAGDTVQISARGRGFAISVEGRALTPGREGHPARVRTGSGRVVVGRPVGERRVELTL
jgi:flagella basal body P-ring formation protein FlgA